MSKSETEQRWRKRVSDWKASGLTCKRYAAREGLNAGTLSHWTGELRRRDKTKTPPLTFVEVAQPLPSGAAPFEIKLPSGSRIQVPRDFDADALRRLLGVLAACA